MTSSLIGEVIEPLQRWERDHDDVRAVYSGSWAESRWLNVVDGAIADHARELGLRLGYSTDYGNFSGTLIGEPRLHRHDRRLCFDLTVVRGDGSGFEERWRGEIELP